jgi:hypothetical protein
VELQKITVTYSSKGNATFIDVLEARGLNGQPFSKPGDSGSLVLDQDYHALGLLFAGTSETSKLSLSYFIPIRSVLDGLNAQLLCGGTPEAPEYHPVA